MLKHKGTYEIICPEEIGLERSNDAGIVLGKLRYESYSCLVCFACNLSFSCSDNATRL
jgi:hypothetical protein